MIWLRDSIYYNVWIMISIYCTLHESIETPNSSNELIKRYKTHTDVFEQTNALPLQSNSIFPTKQQSSIIDANEVLNDMRDSRSLLHANVVQLMQMFINNKRLYGSAVERRFYSHLTVHQLMNRIITKRAVVFMNDNDYYKLRNGTIGQGNWELIGKTLDENTISLSEYLSYDELLLSALCGVSSTTHFINNCNRNNRGKIQNSMEFINRGVFIGLVGARFERDFVMENSIMIINEKQNTAKYGYGKNNTMKNPILSVWKQFYSMEYFPTFHEINMMNNLNDDYHVHHFHDNKKIFFDKKIYSKRMKITMELFLFDADRRGEIYCKNKKSDTCGSFCHIVGLGTGVWAFDKKLQNKLIVKITKNIIENSILSHISFVTFSWMRGADTDFNGNSWFQKNEDGKFFVRSKAGNIIFMEFNKRNPTDLIECARCLLVAMYAWDSNAFPGNEYYLGALDASGDPSAASCSTISYVQNPMINKEYMNENYTLVYCLNTQTGEYNYQFLTDISLDVNGEIKQEWLQLCKNSRNPSIHLQDIIQTKDETSHVRDSFVLSVSIFLTICVLVVSVFCLQRYNLISH